MCQETQNCLRMSVRSSGVGSISYRHIRGLEKHEKDKLIKGLEVGNHW